MTSPWPPPPAPDQHPPAPDTGAPGRAGVLVGWLLLLVTAAAATTAATARLPWASGELLDARRTVFDAGDLVNLGDGVLPSAVLASVVGLVLAVWFGAAAVPAGRVGRIAVTVVVVAVAGVLTAGILGEVDEFDLSTPLGEIAAQVLLLAVLPAAVVLTLLRRRARLAAAGTAAAFAGLAVLGALVTALELVRGAVSVEYGTWTALVIALAGLGGAVLLVRSVPRRVSPARAG